MPRQRDGCGALDIGLWGGSARAIGSAREFERTRRPDIWPKPRARGNEQKRQIDVRLKRLQFISRPPEAPILASGPEHEPDCNQQQGATLTPPSLKPRPRRLGRQFGPRTRCSRARTGPSCRRDGMTVIQNALGATVSPIICPPTTTRHILLPPPCALQQPHRHYGWLPPANLSGASARAEPIGSLRRRTA